MEVLLERCAGLDVHQASVVCCVLIGAPGRGPQKLLRTFGTTTRELEALRAWLAEHGVTHVGMESTGVYWKPVYAVLEGHFDLTVGNAHHIKNVPGRKTDVRDAEWIAQLVRHGLIAKSFVPPPAIRDLRELVRHRRTLIETRTAGRNRVLKLLEGANIKLSGGPGAWAHAAQSGRTRGGAGGAPARTPALPARHAAARPGGDRARPRGAGRPQVHKSVNSWKLYVFARYAFRPSL
jgi:transposase